jgi:riboflavin kinase / FMN adenylyltransferase
MIKWFDEPVPQFDSCVITMGNFDGLHLGHQKVLHELKAQAARLGVPAVVLTYWEHPGHYVHFKHQVSILTPRTLKQAMLREFGAEQVFFLNFTAETAHTEARAFLQDVIIRYFHPARIIAGHDSHFGYQREGNADFLMSFEHEYGFRTIQIEPVLFGTEIISSSLIRQKLQAADLATANAMLGRPYRLYGCVTHGTKVGRTIGFPTINLSLTDIEQLIPANGVYLSSVQLDGNRYFGLTNIGTSPTLKNTGQIEIETFVLDFNREIYEVGVRLDLLEFIREEKSFTSVQDLKQAIAADIRRGKELISRL